ncbi:MAG: Flp pilus assembly complex ATPase component TadA [Candidatus Marsarchaeota archaeon]|nr:Flp pilus assembly complex ATPase component TadA [Candidatus Marsarchaeota archaeon]MCL5112454.1 Flp pilus assembly complex ATPase component TadA [Candidatus Marsarchaeota archaeon]
MDGYVADMEARITKELKGKFVTVVDDAKRSALIEAAAKSIDPKISSAQISEIMKDMYDMGVIAPLLVDPNVEDIMINNTKNIFVYDSREGQKKLESKFSSPEELEKFVNKMKLYATNEAAQGSIMDVHLPTGSRANIIASPLGYDITIRNFKGNPMSIIDLINSGEMDYQIAARLWLYVDGFKIRPANILIGGMPASGKTTLLNAMFSFFRPEQRIVTIEETYELDTRTQENCVRLETSDTMPMVELVKNALRMRPDMIIIGEVRGEEANDMITAMNIGKIAMGTIHASSGRDVINRLQHTPMNVPKDIIPVIDAVINTGVVYENGIPVRKVIEISEISGIESQVLLSDLYKFDYKTRAGSPILPSVTYRDSLSKATGVPPSDILAEEEVRAAILQKLNQLGKKDIKSISEVVRDYYDNPERTLSALELNLSPVVRI